MTGRNNSNKDMFSKKQIIIKLITLICFFLILSIPVYALSTREYGYDDRELDTWASLGPKGHAVFFSNQEKNMTINGIKIFGSRKDNSNEKFDIEIWDSDLKTLYSASYYYSDYFQEIGSNGFRWAKIGIPNLKVDGDFYITLFTDSNKEKGILVGVDKDRKSGHSFVVNKNQNAITEWPNWGLKKESTDWMIRILCDSEICTEPIEYVNTSTHNVNSENSEYKDSNQIIGYQNLFQEKWNISLDNSISDMDASNDLNVILICSDGIMQLIQQKIIFKDSFRNNVGECNDDVWMNKDGNMYATPDITVVFPDSSVTVVRDQLGRGDFESLTSSISFTENKIKSSSEFYEQYKKLDYVVVSFKNTKREIYLLKRNNFALDKVWELSFYDEPKATITSLNNILITHGNILESYDIYKNKIFEFNKEEIITYLEASENGEFIIVCSNQSNCNLLDKSGKEFFSFIGENPKFSLNDNHILSSYKNNLKYIYQSNISLFEINLPDNEKVLSTAISSNGQNFAFTTKDKILIYDINMKKIAEITQNLSDPVIFLSAQGDKLLLADKKTGRISFFIPSLQLLYPEDGSTINANKTVLEWQNIGAEKYILNLNGKAIEVLSNRYEPSEGFALGNYEWSVRGIFSNGIVASSEISKFSIVKTEGIVEVVEKKEELRTEYILGAFGVFVLVMGIVLLPYYKRARLKREMVKTSTDWCPFCHRFTNRVKICPHCGEDTTLIKISSLRNNIKPK